MTLLSNWRPQTLTLTSIHSGCSVTPSPGTTAESFFASVIPWTYAWKSRCLVSLLLHCCQHSVHFSRTCFCRPRAVSYIMENHLCCGTLPLSVSFYDYVVCLRSCCWTFELFQIYGSYLIAFTWKSFSSLLHKNLATRWEGMWIFWLTRFSRANASVYTSIYAYQMLLVYNLCSAWFSNFFPSHYLTLVLICISLVVNEDENVSAFTGIWTPPL